MDFNWPDSVVSHYAPKTALSGVAVAEMSSCSQYDFWLAVFADNTLTTYHKVLLTSPSIYSENDILRYYI